MTGTSLCSFTRPTRDLGAIVHDGQVAALLYPSYT
jgi:hypothetical protein